MSDFLRAWLLGLHRLARRLPVAFFLMLTFAVSWGLPVIVLIAYPPALVEDNVRLPVFFLAVYAPALAALATVFLIGDPTRVDYLRRLVTVGNWRWYAFVLLAVAGAHLLAAALSGAALRWPYESLAAAALALALSPATDPGLFEELGWRGYLLPVLQRRLNPVPAALIVGVIWGLWHLPVMILPGFPQHEPSLPLWMVVGRFIVQTCALSVLMTLFFNASHGAVPLMMVMHWSVNLPWAQGWVDGTMTAWTAVLAIAAAAAILWQSRGALGARDRVVARLY